MAFRLPTFNLSANIWHLGNVVTNPPDLTVLVNLSMGKRVQAAPQLQMVVTKLAPAPTVLLADRAAQMTLLLPALTDIRPWEVFAGGNEIDCVEVPAGSGRYYFVLTVDDVGKGFPNEHRFAHIVQLTTFWMQALYTGNPWAAPVWPIPLP